VPAAALQRDLRQCLHPLLQRVGGQRDVRLVRTWRDAVESLVRRRKRPQELWLTALGSLLRGTRTRWRQAVESAGPRRWLDGSRPGAVVMGAGRRPARRLAGG
jgi:hypothetical protein